jgi:DNA helicase HerA-like ATPase
LEDEIETLKEELVFLYGEGVLKNQPSEFQKTVKEPNKRVVIFDFSQVLDTQTRLNLAGLVLKNLFFKREKGERTITVVEEAHNFAPEKGFGDAEAGKRNLALIMLEKIASEGRKLNLGLWIIAQRPAQVNKYILSQTNTHFLFRLTDKNDLQSVETYLSDTSEGLIKKLPLLGIGECMANGLGVPFEVKLKVE